MTTLQDVADEMQSIADANISDPNSHRAEDNGNWIYSHFPKYGDNATLPRIGFHPVGDTDIPATLGSTATNTEGDLQCTIVVRTGKKYDYDNDGETEEEENLIYFLKKKVKDKIESNHSQLKTNLQDFSYAIPRNSTNSRPINDNTIFLAITFEVRINDC